MGDRRAGGGGGEATPPATSAFARSLLPSRLPYKRFHSAICFASHFHQQPLAPAQPPLLSRHSAAAINIR